jgi:membrane protein YqaA with SNARE-associated domain
LRLRKSLKATDPVNSLKIFFRKYQSYLQGLLLPFGPWGVFAIAMIDAAAFGVPMDPIVAVFVHTDPKRSLLYAVVGAAGSAIGSLVPYLLGYKGGEAFVVKKVGQARFDRVHRLSEKYGDLALIIPGVMPPGFPFKLFVFSAGVAEMNWAHFMLAVFTGRVLRFCILAGLTIEFGPEVVQLAQNMVTQHKAIAIGVLLGLVTAGLVWHLLRRRRAPADVISD